MKGMIAKSFEKPERKIYASKIVNESLRVRSSLKISHIIDHAVVKLHKTDARYLMHALEMLFGHLKNRSFLSFTKATPSLLFP